MTSYHGPLDLYLVLLGCLMILPLLWSYLNMQITGGAGGLFRKHGVSRVKGSNAAVCIHQEWLICSWSIRQHANAGCMLIPVCMGCLKAITQNFISMSNRVRSISGHELPNLFYFSSHKKNVPLRNMFWLHLESMYCCTLWVSRLVSILGMGSRQPDKRGWTVKITEPELRRPLSKTFCMLLFRIMNQ